MRLILASSSPRRQQLLSEMGATFDIIKPDIDESLHDGEPLIDHVQRLRGPDVRSSAASAESHDPGARLGPWYRSPWMWGFVIGVLMLTMMRPFLRRVPPPPPGLAPLATVTWTTGQGEESGWTAIDAEAIALVLVEAAEETPVVARARKVALAWEATDTRRRSVVVLGRTGAGCDTKALRRLALATVTPTTDWEWGCVEGDGWDVLVDAVSEAAPSEVGVEEVIALVDASGWLRAVCDATRDEVVSEVWHRSGHVVANPVYDPGSGVVAQPATADD